MNKLNDFSLPLGFPERPFFDRGGAGFDDRSGRNPRNVMENRRDEATNRPTWNAAAKDEDRVSENSAEQNDSKDKKASRWGNSSPKSIVSEEENWDDDGERKNDGKSAIVEMPQTEPIDDDSDVDFDDGGATATVTEKPVQNECVDAGGDGGVVESEKVKNVENDDESSGPTQNAVTPATAEPIQPPNSFDMFDDNVTPSIRPTETVPDNVDDKNVANVENANIHDEAATECNTTPLYDEPEEKKESAEHKDEHNDIGVDSEAKDENKWEPELPGVPGIDG